ncbi:hypothetical protein TMatcc_008995 [Talaromyces marneffei ATCC 18224]
MHGFLGGSVKLTNARTKSSSKLCCLAGPWQYKRSFRKAGEHLDDLMFGMNDGCLWRPQREQKKRSKDGPSTVPEIHVLTEGNINTTRETTCERLSYVLCNSAQSIVSVGTPTELQQSS